MEGSRGGGGGGGGGAECGAQWRRGGSGVQREQAGRGQATHPTTAGLLLILLLSLLLLPAHQRSADPLSPLPLCPTVLLPLSLILSLAGCRTPVRRRLRGGGAAVDGRMNHGSHRHSSRRWHRRTGRHSSNSEEEEWRRC